MDVQSMYENLEDLLKKGPPFYFRFLNLNYKNDKTWKSLLAKRNLILKNHGYKVSDVKVGYVPGDITKLTDIESAEIRRINHEMDEIQFNGYHLKDLMKKYGVTNLWNL